MCKLQIISFLIFIIFGCKEKHDADTRCFSCENEQNVDTVYNVHAKIINFGQNPINGETSTYGFTIQKRDLQALDGSYITSQDSLFVVCPELDESYRFEGKHVIITYYLKNCNKLITSPSDRTGFGKKIELISIKNF